MYERRPDYSPQSISGFPQHRNPLPLEYTMALTVQADGKQWKHKGKTPPSLWRPVNLRFRAVAVSGKAHPWLMTDAWGAVYPRACRAVAPLFVRVNAGPENPEATTTLMPTGDVTVTPSSFVAGNLHAPQDMLHIGRALELRVGQPATPHTYVTCRKRALELCGGQPAYTTYTCCNLTLKGHTSPGPHSILYMSHLPTSLRWAESH
jgi:hypothetical protein